MREATYVALYALVTLALIALAAEPLPAVQGQAGAVERYLKDIRDELHALNRTVRGV